jgi:hypothetical protein
MTDGTDKDSGQNLIAFLGIQADRRLLSEDLLNLPSAEQHSEPAVSSRQRDRLVAAGSLLTGVTLIAGVALLLYGGWQLVFNGGGALDAALAGLGILLAATHWGWVHVAEYVGLTIDAHQQRAIDERQARWLSTVQPYPRLSVATSVLADASTRVQRVLHRPVLTSQGTFTFVRELDAEEIYAANAPAEAIATAVETMRREARLRTDHLRELWEAAFGTYEAALFSNHDDEQRLVAQRAAATALSEHINAALREPPLVE